MDIDSVRRAPDGSRTHGLVRCVAYRLWEAAGGDSLSDSLPDWFEAQRYVARFLADALVGSEGELSHVVNVQAGFSRLRGQDPLYEMSGFACMHRTNGRQ